jgi:hypothetical protein
MVPRLLAGEPSFLSRARLGIRQMIMVVFRAHQPGAGQRQRDAACVDGGPTPTPLLGDIGGGSRSAGRIKHEVAGVASHQDTALDNAGRGFNYVRFIGSSAYVSPNIVDFIRSEIIYLS